MATSSGLPAVPGVTAVATYNTSDQTETITVTNHNTDGKKIQFIAVDYAIPKDATSIPPAMQTLVDWKVLNVKPGESDTVTLHLQAGYINQVDILARLNPGGNFEGSPSELERTNPGIYPTDPDVWVIDGITWNDNGYYYAGHGPNQSNDDGGFIDLTNVVATGKPKKN